MTGSSQVSSAFLKIESKLKIYLKQFLYSKEDIDDVVQETFLKSYEAEKNTTIESPKSFMFRVARNLAFSKLTNKTNKMIDSIGDIDELNVIDNGSAISQKYEEDCYFNTVIGVMTALPPRCQKVLIMRKAYGYTQKEISLELGISLKTVENHLTKALKKCHEISAENNDDLVNDGVTSVSEDIIVVA